MNKSRSGFTIVELLIVIVVIAILAAISIAAYNGIQTRAENTKTFNAVAGYAKAVSLYAANESTYPGGASYPCLGTVSFCANVSDTGSGCEGAGRAGDSASLRTALSSYASSLPSPSTQSMNCNGKNYSGAWFYSPATGKTANIRAYLRGTITCQSIGGLTVTSTTQLNDTTACAYDFPIIP